MHSDKWYDKCPLTLSHTNARAHMHSCLLDGAEICTRASNVHLCILHFGDQSLIFLLSASPSHGWFATRTFHMPPLCEEEFLPLTLPDQKGCPCSSGCRNMQNASKAAKPFGSRSKQTSKSQMTNFPPHNYQMKRNSWAGSHPSLKNPQKKHTSQTPP